MNSLTEALVTIATAIVGLGIVSVLVSKNANTANILQNAASGFSNAVGTAEAPVTGASVGLNLNYSGNSGPFSATMING